MYFSLKSGKDGPCDLGLHAKFLYPHGIPSLTNRNINCIHIFKSEQVELFLLIFGILNTSFKRKMHLITHQRRPVHTRT